MTIPRSRLRVIAPATAGVVLLFLFFRLVTGHIIPHAPQAPATAPGAGADTTGGDSAATPGGNRSDRLDNPGRGRADTGLEAAKRFFGCKDVTPSSGTAFTARYDLASVFERNIFIPPGSVSATTNGGVRLAGGASGEASTFLACRLSAPFDLSFDLYVSRTGDAQIEIILDRPLQDRYGNSRVFFFRQEKGRPAAVTGIRTLRHRIPGFSLLSKTLAVPPVQAGRPQRVRLAASAGRLHFSIEQEEARWPAAIARVPTYLQQADWTGLVLGIAVSGAGSVELSDLRIEARPGARWRGPLPILRGPPEFMGRSLFRSRTNPRRTKKRPRRMKR